MFLLRRAIEFRDTDHGRLSAWGGQGSDRDPETLMPSTRRTGPSPLPTESTVTNRDPLQGK